MSEYLRIHVERVMHASDSYFVIKARALDSSENYTPRDVTITGHLFGVQALYPGVPLELHGSWVKHQKYGRQFKAKSWRPWADTTMKVKTFMQLVAPNIITNLVQLDTLTQKYGTSLFAVLSNTEKLVAEGTEDDEPTLREISRRWSEMMALGALADSLAEYKLGINAIASIYHKFGLEAEEVLRSNPYRLVEVETLSFVRVDEIARDRGIGLNDLRRVGAAIICSIRECTRQGHLFVRPTSLPRVVTDIISEYGAPPFDTNLVESCTKSLEELVNNKSVMLDLSTGVYLPQHYQYERETGRMLSKMLASKDFPTDIELFITDFEQNNSIELSDQQKEAVRKLIANNVLTVTGAPGTGKTTLIRVFVGLFRTLGLDFALMAPTGIASKRLANVTGTSASTIHRALKYDGFSWGHNSNNPLECDAVVLDEASMVDMELLYRLVSALPSHAMLVIVGDHDQLPSVGPGNVLRELLGCSSVPSIRLEHVFRQAESSDIVKAAHQIRRGLNPLALQLKPESEFQFVRVPNEETLADLIVKIASKLKAKKVSFQIIAPKYEGIIGVDNLNRKLQAALNPDKGQTSTDLLEHPVRLGDRLMVIKNNYKLNVFNGDLGKLVEIGPDGLTIKIYGVGASDDEVFVTVPNDQAPMLLKLAYSVTVHKSQGEEFDTVVMPITKTQGRMLQRNLLYTAITRAKKKVWLLGEPDAVEKSVANDKVVQRNTVLGQLINPVDSE